MTINLRKLLLVIISILVVFILADFVSEKIIEYQYDVILVGSNCMCTSNYKNKCEHLYGINGDTLTELNMNYVKDKSNLNKIMFDKMTDTVVYFDYNTYKSTYKKYNYQNIPDNVILDNHYKYNYNKKDLEMFNKIVESVFDENMDIENFKYYIPTANNYYFFNENDKGLYKYNKQLDTLDLYAFIDSCDIEYFSGK